jgi:microsomal dipeptidase-like Zn-dependent dipeptidase
MDHRLVDLHVHPSLKMHYLPYLRATFHAKTYDGRFRNPFSFRTRYSNLKNSPEKVMLCAHYVIEQGFVAKGINSIARTFAWAAAPLYYGRLRFADPWKTTKKMMRTLERSVANTNRWVLGDGKKLKLVTRYSEIENLADNEIALIHAIEGAHALGYKPAWGETLDEYWEKVKKRLFFLKDRGVCMITLAHFWDNPFVPQLDSTEIASKKRKGKIVGRRDDAISHMKPADWKWDDPDHLAEPFVRMLLDIGILPDVSHAAEHARQKVYDLCEDYNRPVVASHVGLRHFFDHPYNMSDGEILRIHELGGIIGLILSRRWLVSPQDRYGTKGDGIADIVKNMLYIAEKTGDVSAIGIGTDFDGLTDPFKDCETPDKLGKIADAMTQKFTDEQVEQILWGNGMRVLKNGWD